SRPLFPKLVTSILSKILKILQRPAIPFLFLALDCRRSFYLHQIALHLLYLGAFSARYVSMAALWADRRRLVDSIARWASLNRYRLLVILARLAFSTFE